jgi:hypothetical protein
MDEYELKLLNLDRTIPVEVQTNRGIERVELGVEPIKVESTSLPIVDPSVYYFKKVIIE